MPVEIDGRTKQVVLRGGEDLRAVSVAVAPASISLMAPMMSASESLLFLAIIVGPISGFHVTRTLAPRDAEQPLTAA